MSKRPDWRLRKAAALGPDDPPLDDRRVERVRRTLDGSSPDPDIEAALEILEDDRLRGCVEGFLLAGVVAQDIGICRRFNISQDALEAYQRCVFDLDSLDKGDRALVALDEGVPPAVRELRLIGWRHGAAALDHALGIRETLDAGQMEKLNRQLEGHLMTRALATTDSDQLARLVGTLAKLRASGASPSQGGGDLLGVMSAGWRS